ncbi:hypothetical protein WKW79_12730 [Variovorax robiniae]|uniref:Pilus assembly protein PilO n=1 Tax=Variovorax robiniae TaxID=1836199 RepID=A0ABU8X8T5_9BURK
MKKMPESGRLLWQMAKLPALTGLYGIVGIVMVVLALVSFFDKQRPVERDLDAREIELAQKELDLARRAKELAEPPDANAPLPRSVVRTEETYTTFLRAGVRLAAQNHLKGTQIEYRTLSEAGGRLVRYGVQFPVVGTYPDLRNFVIQISQIPGVRIEHMEFTRTQIGDTEVSAQIQLSYLTQVKKP